jgi:hypothetical protein
MHKPWVIRYFILTVTLTLAVCQTEPGVAQTSQAVVSKGNFHSLGVHKKTRRATRRTCWKKVPRRKYSNQRKTFILATGANTGTGKDQIIKANQDAVFFKKAMQKRFKVPEGQVCFLPQVYRNEFERALVDLDRWEKENDRVIIFFSGHGSYVRDDNGDETDRLDDVLVMSDVKKIKKPKRKHVVTDDRLVQLVNKLETRRIITFIDACYAGGMYMGPKHKAIAARKKFFARGELGTFPRLLFLGRKPIHRKNAGGFTQIRGVVFAAAQEHQKAWEDEKGGVFTTTFLEQLKRRPRASFKRLFNYTKAKVRKSKRTKELQQPKLIGKFFW